MILDVRTIEEYQDGHVPDSLHIPLDVLMQEMQAQQLSLLNSRVRLMGVVATQSPSSNSTGSPRGIQSGVALLSLDQQAPKPFKVGDEVEAGLFLLSLAPKSVSLGPSREGPATLTLLLPEPKGL